MTRKSTMHGPFPNPPGAYVHVQLTPREAKIVSMVLADTLTDEIADYFNIDIERVNQIIQKARRRIDHARAKMAMDATKDMPKTGDEE